MIKFKYHLYIVKLKIFIKKLDEYKANKIEQIKKQIGSDIEKE